MITDQQPGRNKTRLLLPLADSLDEVASRPGHTSPTINKLTSGSPPHFLDDTEADANPVVDQLQAATADAVNRFRANGPGLVANGLAKWALLDVPDRDRSKIRGAVRQVMAAESAGLLPLCPHVQQIRPQLLVCDRPSWCAPAAFPAGKRSSRRSDTAGTINATGAASTFRCSPPSRSADSATSLSPATFVGLAPLMINAEPLNTSTRF